MEKRQLKPKVAKKYIFNGNYTYKGLQILDATAGFNKQIGNAKWLNFYLCLFFSYISIIITKLM